MRRVLAIREARLLIVGQGFSMFGDTALFLALGVWVKTLTGSNGAAGLVFFMLGLANLVSPLGGYLVDRSRRRPLMIATNISIGVLVLLLLLVHGRGQVWLIYGVAVLYGGSMVILGSAQSALLTVLLPADLLADGNSVLRTIHEGLRIVGPLAGAAMFATLGGGFVAIVDSASFAIAATCLFLIKVQEEKPQPTAGHWLAEITAGAVHIARSRVLRQIVGSVGAALLVVGFMETVVFAVIAQGLHEPASFLGVLSAVQGSGAVAGALAAPAVMRRLGDSRMVAVGMAGVASGVSLMVAPALVLVLFGFVLAGAGIPCLLVGFTTAIQRRTPGRLQGRVYSAADTLVGTPQILSIALGAALSVVFDYRLLLGVVAVVVAGSALFLLSRAAELAPGAGETVSKVEPVSQG